MTTKTVVMMAMIAALYAVLTVLLAPLSFGVLQFRVSEALKIFVLLDPAYAFGIGLGTMIANIASPFAGPWELIFMPVTDILGGLLAFALFRLVRQRTIFPSMVFYALSTGLSVGWMLSFFGLGAWYLLALPIIGSEAIILLVGSPVLWQAFKWIDLR